MAHDDRAVGPRLLAFVLMLSSLVLLGGGTWLVVLGGSVYYLAAGVALAATALLLWRGSAHALTVFALLFAASLAWSLWEAGLDWWPLGARMGLLFIFGALLLLPSMRGARPAKTTASGRTPQVALAAALAAFVAVALASWVHDPHQREGQLAGARGTPAGAAGGPRAMPADAWHAYGRTGQGQRYSPLDQITQANVGALQEAWRYRTGDVRGQPGDPEETTYQMTPLKIGERLFLCTPHQNVIALDAASGKEVWRFDAQVPKHMALQHLTCRGLSYQPPPDAGAGTAATDCPAGKLFMPTADARLIALDPEGGKRCASFGGGKGEIDLMANMPNPRRGAYYSTSPVVVTERLVIVGGTVLDNVSTREQSGVIRAFDVNTGALVWNWDSGNPDTTAPLAPGQTYVANSPNSWSISSVDEQLGMVYVPMGNAPPDQWGGKRSPATERYSSSVVALDLGDGHVRWVFQTVHHDLWDYDVPSQPSLIDLTINGATVQALVQPTKQGELFVLDRRTGEPVHPVQEMPAPQGAVEGDHTAPTQPRSAISFAPPMLSGRAMWGATLFDQMACRIAFHRLRYEGRFTPPTTGGTLVHPGNFGVFNWGGVAIDPVRQIAFTTPTYVAFTSTLVPRSNDSALVVNEEAPSGALPALNENFGAPFAAKMGPFLSPLGLPCTEPPWGYVAGVDLASGQVVWQHRNGTVRDLAPVPLPFRMGVPNLGGPLLTAGGVAFLSGSLDNFVRAYDVTTGRQLWEQRLPAGGQATPMSYAVDGRQFLLVVAGGHGSAGTAPGDYVIAYALRR